MGRPSKYHGEPFIGKRVERLSNGVQYVYEQLYRYDSVAKKTKPVKGKLIGKILPGTDEIVPTRPKKPVNKQSTTNNVEATRIQVGACDILDWAAKESGIGADTKESMPEGDALKAMSLANYLCATESTLPGFESWQITHPMPYPERISEATCHDLFSDIGHNESWVQSYFERRASRLPPNPALALDSTTFSTYSENLQEARYGYNRENNGLPVVKYCMLYSVRDMQPIAYANKPGNIPDVITLSNALKQLDCLGVEKPTIVTDCGYASAGNIVEFLLGHVKFLTLVKKDLSWVKETVEELLPRLDEFSSVYPADPAIHGAMVAKEVDFTFARKRSRGDKAAGDEEPFKRRLYIGVYCDTQKKKNEAEALYSDIQQTIKAWKAGKREFSGERQKLFEKFLTVTTIGRGGKEKLIVNEEAYKKAVKHMGIFVLVTNKAMDAFEALETYRLREKCEEGFKLLRDQLDGDKPRVQSDDRLRGRQFVQFIAMGLRSFLLKRIKGVKEDLAKKDEKCSAQEATLRKKLLNWLDNRSVLQILQWFDCTRETTVKNERGQYRWSTENVKRDELFLQLLGVKV